MTTETEDGICDAPNMLRALIQDPHAAYRYDTPSLERALALTQGLTHGRRAPDLLLAAVEEVRAQITATLQTRRKLDAQQQQAAQRTQAAATPARPGQGGTRVPRPPAGPGPLPPAQVKPTPAELVDVL